MTMYNADNPAEQGAELPAPAVPQAQAQVPQAQAPQAQTQIQELTQAQLIEIDQQEWLTASEEGVAKEWLTKARDAYDTAKEYYDASIRARQEKAVAHFNNKHAPGSKYYSDTYKTRSRGFRPKTRSVVRRNEAAAVKAFFATDDIVNISAEDPTIHEQLAAAELMHELLNYRLKKTIPWFRTLLGAYQDTLVSGICISYQSWEYSVAKSNAGPALEEENDDNEEYEVVKDRPVVELRPMENVLFSPASDWVDPVGTSPYIIDRISMFIGDVESKIESGEWLEVEEGALTMSNSMENSDSVRRQRENGQDPQDDLSYETDDFGTVWVHRNIICEDGIDYFFYTLGTKYLLTRPVPLTKKFVHLAPGERPYVIGQSIIETHKTYPSSLSNLTESLQQEANDINNQRRDNVALVLNRRYYIRRGAGIDMRSLTRNVPGSVTVMQDVNNDIRVEAPPEITGSSYQEQDRVNLDYDELAGSFSSGSVSSNRQLSETVGGMSMLQGDANEMMEYQLRVFTETWVEPVLRQLVKLEQAYETDPAIMQMAGRNAQFFQKYGVNEVNDRMLQGTMTLELNVGFGATNPQKRIEKLSLAIRSIAEFAPNVIQGLDPRAISEEVFGALGFKGVERFIPSLKEEGEDPQIQQLQQQLQQLQQQLQSQMHMKEADRKRAVQVEEIRAKSALEVEQFKAQAQEKESQTKMQVEASKTQLKHQIDQYNTQINQLKGDIEAGKLKNARDALDWKMQMDKLTLDNNDRAHVVDAIKNLNVSPSDGASSDSSSTQASEGVDMPNPNNDQSTVIANDDYGDVPGQKG